MNDRIPVTIISGFLGSGKTTIIANLIRQTGSRRFAVLVNEFGEVSIDDRIIEKHSRPESVEIHRVTGGLLAYSSEDEFLPAMLALANRRSQVDHVLIETSGLAVPTAIIEKLNQGDLNGTFVVDATIIVIDTPLLINRASNDAERIADKAHIEELLLRQLEAADVVVLNKIDGCSGDQLLEAERMVREMVPTVRFLELAYKARLDPGLVLGLHLNQSTAEHARGVVLPGASIALVDGHSHSGIGTHDHGIMTHEHLHEHDPGWMSFLVRTRQRQIRAILENALSELATCQPVLRAKGFISIPDSNSRLLVQAVRSRVSISPLQDAHLIFESKDHHDHVHVHNHDHDHVHVQDHDHDPEYPCELVFIGYHLSRQSTIRELNRLTSSVWE